MVPDHKHKNCDCIDIVSDVGHDPTKGLYAARITAGYFRTREEAAAWNAKTKALLAKPPITIPTDAT